MERDQTWLRVIARDCAWLGVIGPYETGSRQKTSVIHRDSPWFTVIPRDSLCFMATSIDFQDFKASPHTITFFCVDIRQIDLCLEHTNRVIDLIEKQSWMKLHVPELYRTGGWENKQPQKSNGFPAYPYFSLWTDFWPWFDSAQGRPTSFPFTFWWQILFPIPKPQMTQLKAHST